MISRSWTSKADDRSMRLARAADAEGNLYTGPNTEDTPAIVEATAFSGGIVIAQVNEMVDGKTTTLPRIDIPADWVSFVVKAPRPNFIEPLFTRDPAQISEAVSYTHLTLPTILLV